MIASVIADVRPWPPRSGVFTPVVAPEEVVVLLFATLVGAMIPRVLRFPGWSADGFRTALLRQVAEMLGRPGYQ